MEVGSNKAPIPRKIKPFNILPMMLRDLGNMRRNPFEYEQLHDETSNSSLIGEKLEKGRSALVQILGNKREPKIPENPPSKKSNNNQHPLMSLFDTPKKKKKTKTITAKPEFSRYLEYLKEGGIWDLNSDMPVMYYK